MRSIAKYGQEEFEVGADLLFTHLEAELALKHTKECDNRLLMLTTHLD